MEDFARELKSIGSNVTDVYFGNLEPVIIKTEVAVILNEIAVASEENLDLFLRKIGDDYANIALPDDSIWTLRRGTGTAFAHVHPAKFSPLVRRFKAPTLKTAVLAARFLRDNPGEKLSLEILNRLRYEFLDLSPVKYVPNYGGLAQTLALLVPEDNLNFDAK